MPRFDMYTDPAEGSTNDLVLDTNGEFRFTQTLQESLAQRIEMVLNVWQGEWAYNLLHGTPYKQRIFSAGLTKEEIDAEIIRVISSIDDITSISEVVSEYDRFNRVYTLKQVNVFVNDEELTIPISSPQERTNNYPEPRTFEDFQICDLGDATEEEINDLYYLINFAMSDFNTITGQIGETTWWNTWSDNLP